ncbi:MAG TPA: cupin domain-containing protein [Verrucomicrobiae bacterium]|jgi:oxalate decarboxylase
MKNPRLLRLLFALALASSAPAQTPNLVFRDRIDPHWFAGADGSTNKFWYRVETGARQHEYVLVDAEAGKRSPAFDHARLEPALSKATGRPAEAGNLPIDGLRFASDGKSVTLRSAGSSWKLDLDSYSVTASASGDADESRLAAARAPHPSYTTGTETEITLVNRLSADVNLFWIDPDGKRQPYGVLHAGERREQNTYAGHVWLATSAGGDVIAVFEATAEPGLAEIGGRGAEGPRRRNPGRRAVENGARSPDGHWEVFVHGDNLFLRDLKANGSPEEALTFDANPNSAYARDEEADREIEMNFNTPDPETPTPEVYWAPDSKHFAAMRMQPGTHRRVYLVESSPEDQLQPKLDSYPYLKPGDQVPIRKPHLFDVEAKKEIAISDALFANPWSVSDVRWSRDSGHFTFLFNQRGHQVMRIVAVDARSGEARPIVDEHSATFIDYSGKTYSDYLDDSGEILWASERDGWNHLYLFDANTGQLKNQVTRGEWAVRGVESVDETHRKILFQAGGLRTEQDPYYAQLCRVNFDGSGMTALTEGDGAHETRFSPGRAYFIDTWSRVDLPPINVLRRSSDGHLVCKLEEGDASALVASGWQMPERFTAQGRDGVTYIYGVIWRPKGFDAGKKYPVIEDIYAGPQDFFTPKNFRSAYQQQTLANHGFVVVQMRDASPNGYLPPATDHGEAQAFWSSFSTAHRRIQEGGWSRQITIADFPISKDIAGVNMRLTAGGIRELHWHNAAEWAIMLNGRARITALDNEGRGFVDDVAKDDLWYFPTGVPHSIQGLGPDGAEFLLVFDDSKFSEANTTLISDWLRHTPPEVLAKNWSVTKKDLSPIYAVPADGRFIYQTDVPGSLEQDQASISGARGKSAAGFSFHLGSLEPAFKNKSGEVRVVDSRNFPASATIAAAHVILRPGGLRELHWHQNADEWQYFIQGKGRMTVFFNGSKARTADFAAGDVGYVPRTLGHYVENTGETDLIFLEMFRTDRFQDLSLSEWVMHIPPELLKNHIGIDRATVLSKLGDGKMAIVPG